MASLIGEVDEMDDCRFVLFCIFAKCWLHASK